MQDGVRSVAFIKKMDRHNAVIVQLEKTKEGKIIWHKSFFDQRKEPYKNIPDLKDIKPLGGGGIPISHTEKSVPGSNRLSTPNGLESESKNSKSSSNLQEKRGENSSGVDFVGESVGDNDKPIQVNDFIGFKRFTICTIYSSCAVHEFSR